MMVVFIVKAPSGGSVITIVELAPLTDGAVSHI